MVLYREEREKYYKHRNKAKQKRWERTTWDCLHDYWWHGWNEAYDTKTHQFNEILFKCMEVKNPSDWRSKPWKRGDWVFRLAPIVPTLSMVYYNGSYWEWTIYLIACISANGQLLARNKNKYVIIFHAILVHLDIFKKVRHIYMQYHIIILLTKKHRTHLRHFMVCIIVLRLSTFYLLQAGVMLYFSFNILFMYYHLELVGKLWVFLLYFKQTKVLMVKPCLVPLKMPCSLSSPGMTQDWSYWRLSEECMTWWQLNVISFSQWNFHSSSCSNPISWQDDSSFPPIVQETLESKLSMTKQVRCKFVQAIYDRICLFTMKVHLARFMVFGKLAITFNICSPWISTNLSRFTISLWISYEPINIHPCKL